MAQIPHSTIRDILDRVDIVDIISQYVSLKKTGANYKGLCPFHKEKTSSFIVSQEKQIFHCFGCSVGGDAISFLTKYENSSFIETMQKLATQAGVHLPDQNYSHEQNEQHNKSISLLSLASDSYNKFLLNTSQAEKAREYLEKRKFSNETIKEFQLGFAPNAWDALLKKAKINKYTEHELFNSGLVVQNKTKSGYYDRFRNRLIFPISNPAGKIVGFGARVLDDSLPKYINSPENPLFNKSKILYGLDKAKKHILSEDRVITVEGYFDMIRPFQEGIKNVVATLGTALTEHHAKALRRLTRNVTMIFDSDAAGIQAVNRSIDMFLEQEFNVSILTLDKAKDPDEYILKFGAEKFKKIMQENTQDFLRFKLNQLSQEFDIHDEIGKTQIATNLIKTTNIIENLILKNEYLTKVANALNIPEEIIKEHAKTITKNVKHDRILTLNKKKRTTKTQEAEKIILKIMLENKKNYGIIISLIEKYKLKINSEIFICVLDIIKQHGYKHNKEICAYINDENIKNELTNIIFKEINTDYETQNLKDCIKTLLLHRLDTDITDLKKQQEKLKTTDKTEWSKLIKKIADLNKEKAKTNEKGVNVT